MRWKLRNIPNPTGLPLIGNALQIIRQGPKGNHCFQIYLLRDLFYTTQILAYFTQKIDLLTQRFCYPKTDISAQIK